MKPALVLIGAPVAALLVVAAVRFAKKGSARRLLQLLGSACLAIVVLVHVAEGFQLLPWMGWGRPDSVGHYLDLVSLVAGTVLLAASFAYGTQERSRPAS